MGGVTCYAVPLVAFLLCPWWLSRDLLTAGRSHLLGASLLTLGSEAAWGGGHSTEGPSPMCPSVITDKSVLLAGPFSYLFVRDDNIITLPASQG